MTAIVSGSSSELNAIFEDGVEMGYEFVEFFFVFFHESKIYCVSSVKKSDGARNEIGRYTNEHLMLSVHFGYVWFDHVESIWGAKMQVKSNIIV